MLQYCIDFFVIISKIIIIHLNIKWDLFGQFFEVGEVVGVSRSNFEKRHIELVQEFYSHLKDTSRQKRLQLTYMTFLVIIQEHNVKQYFPIVQLQYFCKSQL